MSELRGGTADGSDSSGAADPGDTWHQTGSERETAHGPGYESRSESDDHAEYDDAELDARIAAEDTLPTRQEARAYTWGENADNPDPGDSNPGLADGGDLGAFITEQDRLPTRQEARAYTWGDTDSGPTAEAPDSSAAIPAERAERSPADNSERIATLEAEITQLGVTITDLRAHLERVEHTSQSEAATKVTGKESDSGQQAEIEETKGRPRRWGLPSDAAVALGATTASSVITTIADHVPYLHADIAGMLANAVAVGAAGVTWMRSKNEGKHGHRPKD